MKIKLRLLPILLLLIVLFTLSSIMAFSGGNEQSITILFTHDLHDQFYPVKVEDAPTSTLGGYGRLYTAIKQERAKDPELLLVDGGDFSMGTLFQTIFAQASPQLRIMGAMGYDVTTLGNHEFDFRADGLAAALKTAKASGDKLPAIVASNVNFIYGKEGLPIPELKSLHSSMKDYGVKEYQIFERDGVRIGVFGLMGKDSASNAPMAGVVFDDAIESAERIVEILKNQEKVDLVLCLSHSGTDIKKSKSEDEILAQKVPGIDVIISGHSHTELKEPIIVGSTVIGSGGSYGQRLGIIKLSKSEDGKWSPDEYRLKPIDDSLDPDPEIVKIIEGYKDLVQKNYLDNFNMSFDDILAYTPFSFTPLNQLETNHTEQALGNLISDAYIYSIKNAEGPEYELVTAAIVPVGTVRGSFIEGNIRVSDVFNVSSLGIGKDKIPGYPLITVYLTGKELKTIAEVDASVAPIMSTAQLYVSGMSYTFNPNRLIFNKVTEVALQDHDGIREEIDDNKLYRVAAGLYSAQMLSVVGEKSFGLLSLVPKTKDGTPVTDFEELIIYDDDKEVKEWIAIARYLKSFDTQGGTPIIPKYYSETQGRKNFVVSKDPISLFKNPNKIALLLYISVAAIFAIVIFIVLLIRKVKRAGRHLKNNLPMHTPQG
ncbi:bifunctional UDP-sugar hydrolase/5'-nucleotidase [Bacillota bacterium]